MSPRTRQPDANDGGGASRHSSSPISGKTTAAKTHSGIARSTVGAVRHATARAYHRPYRSIGPAELERDGAAAHHRAHLGVGVPRQHGPSRLSEPDIAYDLGKRHRMRLIVDER